MNARISRRQFFQWTGCGLFAAAFPIDLWRWGTETGSLARVTRSQINIYRDPDFQSEIIARKQRDDLIHVYYPLTVERGVNRLWYRTWGGYVHCAYLQPVSVQLNPVLDSVPEPGVPVEVTVPFSQSMRYRNYIGWEPIYRLYYGSVHWIDDVIDGPDGGPWYRLVDSYNREYYARAEHLRPIKAEEIEPIARDVPPEEKRIAVSISKQQLTAFEGDRIVLDTRISSGVRQEEELKEGEVSSDTPIGNFRITVKAFFRHMGGTQMTSDLDYRTYPGVPWVGFFHHDGYAFHGTYWHYNFGVRMSGGCINMKTDEALWLFRWSDPVITIDTREVHGPGTRVQIFE